MNAALVLLDGPDVVILVRCRVCRRTVRVRWPERWGECGACTMRATAIIAVGVA